MKRLLTLTLIALTFVGTTLADEGMWLPSLIGKQIKTMKAKGLKLSAEDLYSVNRASLKDGIVQFDGGCTGELISAEGLLLTNHHCGYSQIQSHSSVENDYLTNGFWAMNRGEELPNPGLEVAFLVRMDDVTEKVLEGTTAEMDDEARAKHIKQVSKAIADAATEDGRYKSSVEPFYYGNQYFLFIYEVFRDVRLVAAPPSSIGKFGGDTDNWMWPRHTGDFSMFRIYADKDNRPADYSKDNVPYKPKKHFTISTKGVHEGDFTFVYGFPGRTSEYLTSDAVDFVLNYSNPAKILMRTLRLDVINKAQDQDVATRIKYASKNASIANAWKKWQGESKGIARLKTIDRKRSEEAAFEKWAVDKPEYGSVVPNMRRLYGELLDYARAVDYYREGISGVELLKFAGSLSNPKLTDDKRKALTDSFFKDYVSSIDRDIAVLMFCEVADNLPSKFVPKEFSEGMKNGAELFVGQLFRNSALIDRAKFDALTDEQLKNDPAVVLMAQFDAHFNSTIRPKYSALNNEITKEYRTYMRGLMAMQPQRNFYPDANFTLRVAYGNVAGYESQDAIYHRPVSTLNGIIEKDNPLIYDYNIPQRLRDVYAARDFGRWSEGGKVPVAFIATNHTTGGNSGSPVLNSRGELIGLNFDRTWLSTMSDIEFDPTICRNIALDIRYMLFVVDKIGGASYLFDEMDMK